MSKRKTDDLTIRAAQVAERILLNADFITTLEEAQNMLSQVYRVLHTGNSVECRKNHPAWTEELFELENGTCGARI